MTLRAELWAIFGAIVLASLVVDMGLPSHRHRSAPMSFKEAAGWSMFWIALSLAFNVIIYVTLGTVRATEFLTAYLVEKSLSVDNMFIFMLIFDYFKTPALFQPKVLKYGIFGAIGMRLLLILAGVALMARFHWVLYVFGVVLVVTAIQMMRDVGREMQPEANWVLRLGKKFLPFVHELHDGQFLVREGARWVATPLMATLLVVEASDLVFAADSIPAVLAISHDPLIAFSSNVFAILGLRSLYFVLHDMMGRFRYLKYGLGVVLIFIGAKMLLVDLYPIRTMVSLAVVAVCLLVSALLSLRSQEQHA